MVEAEVEAREQSVAKKIRLEPTNNENDSDSILDEKIRQQLEYYFSDVNIIRDKFLMSEIKKNDDGWVKLSVLLTFSRLQQLTKDEKRIIEALKRTQSDTIELEEAEKQIRRKEKLPDVEEYKKDLELRTVHISGFPTDYTYENLLPFCQQYGPVDSVNMRRHFKTRFFKGCIHAVFKKVEDAKKVLETVPLKCKDRELRTESMEQYHKRKAEMAQKRQENRKKGKGGGHNEDGDKKSDENESDQAKNIKEEKSNEADKEEKVTEEEDSKKEEKKDAADKNEE